MCDSVRPHRWQPTRLHRPWDSPGKNTGVGCHFLLQCVKVKSESEAAQSCPTLHHPMDCSLPVSSVHGISQARVLEWGTITFSNIFLLINNYLLNKIEPYKYYLQITIELTLGMDFSQSEKTGLFIYQDAYLEFVFSHKFLQSVNY